MDRRLVVKVVRREARAPRRDAVQSSSTFDSCQLWQCGTAWLGKAEPLSTVLIGARPGLTEIILLLAKLVILLK